MLNQNGRFVILSVATSALVFAFCLSKEGRADSTNPNVFDQSQQVNVLGSTMGAEFATGTPNSSQVTSTATLEVLGKRMQAMQASVNVPDTIDGTTYAEFYSFGLRVFSENFYFQHQGLTEAKVGLAPMEIRVPLIAYPVGPLILEISAGGRFQADLDGKLQPTFMNPIAQSIVGVNLNASANGAGFIEGDASLIAVRGGVGGQLGLLDAQADVNTNFFFDGRSPLVDLGAMVDFLNGKLFAFLDVFSLIQFGWNRLWEHDFYSWGGYCFSTGNISCPAK